MQTLKFQPESHTPRESLVVSTGSGHTLGFGSCLYTQASEPFSYYWDQSCDLLPGMNLCSIRREREEGSCVALTVARRHGKISELFGNFRNPKKCVEGGETAIPGCHWNDRIFLWRQSLCMLLGFSDWKMSHDSGRGTFASETIKGVLICAH